MLSRILNGVISILLLATGTFLVFIVVYLISTEVMPALDQGSLNVQTSTMILNRVWHGNEIYILLVAYLLVACASLFGAIRFGTKAFPRKRSNNRH